MRDIDFIVLHTSDSRHGTVTAIRAWHIARGWRDIGYHFVICNGILTKDLFIEGMNGAIEYGRPISQIPASVYGHNHGQIAICMIGKDGEYTKEQFDSCIGLIQQLQKLYNIPIGKVIGHYELDSSKTCPNIDMDKFRTVLTMEKGV